MRILNLIKYLLAVVAIIFIFFNWKISIILFLIASILHVIPTGPSLLFSIIKGSLMIGGIIYLFISWEIGSILIISSFLVAKFRLWGNKINYDYYKKVNKRKAQK